jgi:Rho-binding antiterminator
MTDPYKPIACALHDEFEIAIMHRQKLRITWLDDSGCSHDSLVLPVDTRVDSGEEFLIAEEEGGKQLTIRLDRISIDR